ncbi:3,4-dihydroxy-2-butanone-4-phosphate synthase [Gordonia sp. SL306]|uniref:3,4-dihydroxy-2-butanone-4-phosphate synthase n=1 Tax=Gordonia sp. SL306 TaxID=2995145 RepID=UPI00226D8259|nr:3,4-dihydroxy-2-butanone-4-phosphate synthase [Gordonia sp. SL306]WAC54041.1 3,4-dihydroxy-2-butanone-4-phosphate synthase [Gordonia sp. SL306]
MSAGSLLDLGMDFGDSLQEHGDCASAQEAVSRLRRGEMVMICDDVSVSPRYDLVCAADRLTTEQTAFLVRHTSGFLQVALRDARCDRLQLPPVAPTVDRRSSQQCVGVDAAAATGTGISATDRTQTINTLGRRDCVPSDFTRPGHVLPVRVAVSPPWHELAGLALGLTECAGSVAAVFATLVGTGRRSDGLLDRAEAQVFAARHHLQIIGYCAAGHVRGSRAG